jgi:hypothetical protein
MPHLLAADPVDSDDPAVREVLREAGGYLYARGEYQAAADHVRRIHRGWLDAFGPDHLDTLRAAGNLATYLAALGYTAAAKALDEDTLARRRRVLGDDHPETLISAGNFANRLAALGEMEAARRLDEDTLARCRRVLGDDHPTTLTLAANLANRLAALREIQAARRLYKDASARRRRVLGDDHPDTRRSVDDRGWGVDGEVGWGVDGEVRDP